MSHAVMGILTCATIHSIEIDRKRRHPRLNLSDHFLLTMAADEGGSTSMSGGIPWITLPAGYLGSSFIGACLIACGFDTDASKVASLVLAGFFLFTLWWARKDWLSVCHFIPYIAASDDLVKGLAFAIWNGRSDCIVLVRRGRYRS
jgi:hypothetical protein